MIAKKILWLRKSLIALFSLIILTNVALAQLIPPAFGAADAVDIVKTERVTIGDLQRQLKNLNTSLVDRQNDEQDLSKLRNDLQQLVKQTIVDAIKFRTPLNDINLRLDQLGLVDNGGKEPKAVTDERGTLQKQKAEINGLTADLEDIYVSANTLLNQTIVKGRELFARALTHRVEFNSALGKDILQSTNEVFWGLKSIFVDWWENVLELKLGSFIIAILIPLVIAIIFYRAGRYMSRRLNYKHDHETAEISYLSRLTGALLSALIPLIGLTLFFSLTIGLMDFLDVLDPEMSAISRALSSAIVLALFIGFMAAAIFSPKNPHMQLISIAPQPGRLLVVLLTAIATVVSADHLLKTIYRTVDAPISLTVVKSLVTVILVSLLIFAISLVKPRQSKDTGRSIGWPLPVRIILIVLAALPLVAGIAGYIGLARYITQQIVVSGAFVVLLYLGLQTGRAIANEGALANTSLGQLIVNKFKVDPSHMDQLGLALGILLNLVVIIVCIPPIAMQIGFSWDDIYAGFLHLLTGFQIGNVSVSLIAIITGLIFFFVSWFIVRWFVNWLDGTVLARGKVDSGVRNSIRTVIGYLGIALAALVGLSAAGFNLASLAIVAGGLSLGIGFGLQNIVQNFVSGLILLAERPFKVGDYIETGSIVGTVKRISVRATEVETTKRQTIVVPNSSLINNNVGNWTRRNRIGRVDLPFTVPAIIDPKHVYDILIEIAGQTEGVLKNPAPYVSFSAFDSNNFTFTLCAFYPDIVSTTVTSNALRFAIYKRFSDEGIAG